MYIPWVLYVNKILDGAYAIDQFIRNSWGQFVEYTFDARNVVLDILHHDMDSYVQHQNALRNYDHVENFDAPWNCGDGASRYEVIKCVVNNNLGTASEANDGRFVLGDDAYEDPE